MNEEVHLLYDAIDTLTAVDKAIILLHLEDQSYDEIASITGLSKTNVSVRLVLINATPHGTPVSFKRALNRGELAIRHERRSAS